MEFSTPRPNFFPANLKRFLIPIIFVAVLSAVFYYAGSLTPNNDWKNHFRPAALEFLSGRSPYTVEGFYNPPWALLPLLPLTPLPPRVGNAVLGAIAALASYTAALRLGSSRKAAYIFLLNPYLIMILALNANIDWMVLLGATLPPQFGLFLVLIKPQLGAGVALFWLVSCWRKGGLREVVRTFAPTAAAFLLSFFSYGFYLSKGQDLQNVQWNTALWPLSIPVGVVLIAHAVRFRKIGLALLGTPFLSPYMTEYTWAASAIGLASVGNLEVIAAALSFWGVLVLKLLIHR